jgi:energy-coupling factor transporter ATP-binding protein EcfA2
LTVQISEIRILGMRGIVAFEHRLFDPWLGRIPDVLLVSGLNGSGKTTLLNAIANLWRRFGFFLDGSFDPRDKNPAPGRYPLLSCRLVAVKLEALADAARPVWLFAARLNEWNDLKPSLADCDFAGVVHDGKGRLRLEFSDQSWAKDMQRRRKESMAGRQNGLPNVVHVASGSRGLGRARAPQDVPADEPMPNWYAVYDDKISLINSLYRQALNDPSAFVDTLNRVNSFLEQKRIIGFDERLALFVETSLGAKHGVNALSTGEKQALILVAFANRWLKPGGILLVDEPDLYMHPSWTEQIVTVLTNIVRSRQGQFLFASHSPILWENFSRDAEQIRMEIKAVSGNGAPIAPAAKQGAQ